MNILVISRGIPTKKEPQLGNFEFDQAKALVKLGHDVSMASVDSRFRLFKRKIGLTYEEREGVKLYNFFLCPSAITGLLGQTVKDSIIHWQWQKIINAIQKTNNIDIIYSHYLFNTYAAVKHLNKLNAPIVGIEHWSEINKPKLLPTVKKMGDAIYPQINRLLTVSHATQKAIKRHFNQESTVVYNMVSDTFTYKNLASRNNKVNFITIGSLIPRKGFDLLIDAFAKLQLPSDTWELKIVGTGNEKNRLSKQIAHQHLEQNIHLLGSRTSDEIVNLLNQSDIFVLPSRSETFGVVYIEAMACGLPVIATPCGGPEEFVNEKNGLLVPINDVVALEQAIKYMFSHYKEYNRQAIADDCHSRFSSAVIAKQLTKIFDEVRQEIEPNSHTTKELFC